MRTTQSILSAFAAAQSQFPDLQAQWTRISHTIGGRVPGSLITVSVQRVGRLDALLRAMESEFSSGAKQGFDDVLAMATDYHTMFSESWVGSLYEIVRSMRERGVGPASDAFEKMHHDLRLIRVPLEKYEIAEDGKLKKPLEFIRIPEKEGDAPHFYDGADRNRAHIMPMGLSERGSLVWHATDLRAKDERWIERQYLSDTFLNLWIGG